ncbi:kinase-like domain-containing protein [Suillus subalutaceus]|uniref:kinase-like domain-containing protein n=1 Tax=Suillus subalutaceus TaxID=48586 RepID=UPI001B877BE8|nr:kinase-like domain-containing protein [Suillus subalutaceus]KAG1854798.1 kinase-like domain-containing protein [Suillus subalutaceus]
MYMSKQSTSDLVDLTDRITRTSPFCSAGGGFGDIWRCALQTGATQDVVAVKAIRFQSGEVSASHEKALRRELEMWKILVHINILPLLGIARNFSPSISMVSPWCENGSLAAYLQQHKGITVFDRLHLLQDVTSGLHYLHGIPMVHGDLTPNNVLLNNDKRAVLTDFGLSSMLGDITGFSYVERSCAQPGAIRYSAPELLILTDSDTSIQPDIRSDVYSFGCLALKVLSGNEPWADVKHWRFIIIKVTDGHTQQRPTHSPVLDEHWRLIQRCFLQPDARPSTRDILKFLEAELQSEDQKLSAVNQTTKFANRNEAISFGYKTTVNTSHLTHGSGTSPIIAANQHIASTSSSFIPDIPDKGQGSARKFSLNVFRRNNAQSIKTRGANIEQETTGHFAIIEACSLKIVEDFAVAPGGLGNTFQCILQKKAFKKEKVAVKSIKVRDDNEGSIKEAHKIIMAKVQSWMSLRHENILPVYGTTTGFGSSLPCLVSPWMENGSLTSYLSAMDQTLTSAAKFSLLFNVAAGLRFLHSNEIIHGNLSSDNVLIDNRHTVRLADYGLSSVVSMCGELFQSYHCGALRWTAPEMISNDDQELDNESRYCIDIYSFGCIMLHVLSGKLPYWWLDDVLRVVSARHNGVSPVRCGTEMHEGHVEFVQHCLSVSPTDRPTIDKIDAFIARSTRPIVK